MTYNISERFFPGQHFACDLLIITFSSGDLKKLAKKLKQETAAWTQSCKLLQSIAIIWKGFPKFIAVEIIFKILVNTVATRSLPFQGGSADPFTARLGLTLAGCTCPCRAVPTCGNPPRMELAGQCEPRL